MNDNAAYVIGNITVKNPEKWAEYRSKVPATLAQWGAELVFRGKKVEVFSGIHEHIDTVVIRFPNAAAAKNWYQSSDYQALVPLREQGADMVLVCYAT